MKMLFVAFALASATAASADPATDSALGFDQDLIIVGRAPAADSAEPTASVRAAETRPSDTQRTSDRSSQDALPAA